ncbi:hypothetical protein H6768_05785 [Candidatus Peribacteria bacterium]|nr:hypothetical protein [Candidatus Peribacteria bacterium]
MNNEGELIITFDHTNEETSGLIYASFDRALNFLLENHKKIPDGRSLGICLEKNNSKKVGLWAYCYIRFLNALRNGRQTGNHALDTSIKKARDILGQLKDETELHY